MSEGRAVLGPAQPLLVIPARLKATRLPDKPLALIAGEPMIVHVWRRGIESQLGRVVVAAGDAAIVAAVRAAGGEAVLTRADHPSGSDRVDEAVERLDPDGRHDAIINLQGDLPLIAPGAIRRVVAPLDDPGVDIATLIGRLRTPAEHTDPNVVKAIVPVLSADGIGEAKDFTRTPARPGDPTAFHHIGIYAYRRAALRRFVRLPPSPREVAERLEQLRALEAGMRIGAALVDSIPYGVDTPADLERARRDMAGLISSGHK